MKQLSAVATIKRWLRIGRGAERFELPEIAESKVRQALLRAARGRQGPAEMDGVLRLLVALETRLGSPTAGARLRAWMRATPEIHDVIRGLGFAGVKGLDLTRAFKQREGRATDLAAPKVDAVAPAGSVPLHRLLEQRPRRRDPR